MGILGHGFSTEELYIRNSISHIHLSHHQHPPATDLRGSGLKIVPKSQHHTIYPHIRSITLYKAIACEIANLASTSN